jgi:hypothetical protein
MSKKIWIGFVVIVFLVISMIPIDKGLPQIKETQTIQSTSSDMVYSPTPDWESGSPAYSTGAALTDINCDSWLDLVVSDGNDMDPGHLRVYLNDGNGHLPTTASWESSDVAYNGHLDVADVNGDGWPDVAVSYLGNGGTTAPIARVYMNNNGVLSSTADWTANIIGEGFGVDFGDMNNDGRPDLAVATGNPYTSLKYHTYVYQNVNGSYGSSPTWESSDQHINLGVLWVDADDDGWLDLAGIGSTHQTEIYRNLDGVLETTASWQTSDGGNTFGIMLTAGDVTGDGVRDLFATANTQLGGSDGWFKQYTGLSTGFFETTHSWEYYADYGSAVALADVNGDNALDLVTGAWWDHTNLFLNQGVGLPTAPSWSSADATVNEKIVFGNVGPTKNERIRTQVFPGDGVHRLFYLSRHAIEYIVQVKNDGVILTPSDYTYSRDLGWLTVSHAPTSSLEVTYAFSYSLDMVVTNWDPDIGNYLYYNQLLFADLKTIGILQWNNVAPGQTLYGNFTLMNDGNPGSSLDWSVNATPSWGTWTVVPSAGENLKPEDGPVPVQVSVVAPTGGGPSYYGTIVVANQNDPEEDVERIPVWLNFTQSLPVFNLTSIKGPLGISLTFQNTGKVPATHVNWSITVTGGLFHMINKESHNTMLSIIPGQEKTVKMNMFFGVGKIQGTFMVGCDEGVTLQAPFSGIQFLFFTIPKSASFE